ncbi:MAG: MotA/TolQ/ExbB proton channel family protein [Halanaerobiales bacterium]|nr:MotA/TolQ/ExbB proton channel family protein [Halanaerobiales bacterium]
MFFSSIFSNLWGYDSLIFIVAIANLAIVFPMLRKTSTKLNQSLNPIISKPIDQILKTLKLQSEEKLDLHMIKRWKENENLFYQIYISITSIFPLLGILGTIIAMLTLGDFTSNLVVVNFTKALTSTFWGLVWGIFFKSLEGFIVPYVQQNEENLKLLLYRLDQSSQDKVEDHHEE